MYVVICHVSILLVSIIEFCFRGWNKDECNTSMPSNKRSQHCFYVF